MFEKDSKPTSAKIKRWRSYVHFLHFVAHVLFIRSWVPGGPVHHKHRMSHPELYSFTKEQMEIFRTLEKP